MQNQKLEVMFNFENQSVESRHDQPFFMSHRSDPLTLDLESPEISGYFAFRVTEVIRRLYVNLMITNSG